MDVTTITALTTLFGGSPGIALNVVLCIAIFWLNRENKAIRARSEKLTDQIAQERTELQAQVKQLTETLITRANVPTAVSGKGEHTA